jgi:hypothetical protein
MIGHQILTSSIVLQRAQGADLRVEAEMGREIAIVMPIKVRFVDQLAMQLMTRALNVLSHC